MAEYEVEEVLDCMQLTSDSVVYLVKWKNYSHDYNTWEPWENLKNCPQRMKIYQKNGPNVERTEVQKMESYLSQMNDGEIQAVMKRFRNKKGEITNIIAPDPIEVQKQVMRFIENRKLLMSRKDFHSTHMLLLLQKLHQKRAKQMSDIRAAEDLYNGVSEGQAPLTIENKFDFESPPSDFTYINHSLPRNDVTVADDPVIWCQCKKNCNSSRDSCCGEINSSDFAYSRRSNRLKLDKGTPIYECNKKCACDESCPNRVVQKGIKIPLTIFRTSNNRGWGVKTKEKIKAGTFVCEYVGEILTNESSLLRKDQTYYFNLDFNATEDSVSYVLDAKNYGNVSHFINHSCNPNLEVFAVYINNLNPDLHLVALFAKRDIAKNEELSFCYMDSNAKKGKMRKNECRCGSPDCLGFYYLM